MYVAIRHCYDTNEILTICHNTDILKLRELCDISINNTIACLNTNPDIIYARKFSDNHKEVIVYRIGFRLDKGYLYTTKNLIENSVYNYRILFVSDKKYYQPPFSYVIVDDYESKNGITTKSLPENLLNSLQTKNKSDLL